MAETIPTGMESPDSSLQSHHGPLSSKGHVLSFQANSEKADREVDFTVKSLQDFPEGGLRAWLTVIGGYASHSLRSWASFLIQYTFRTMVAFCTFRVVQSFGVYQDYYGVGSFLFAGIRPDPILLNSE